MGSLRSDHRLCFLRGCSIIIILVAALLFCGCAATQLTGELEQLPQLIKQEPLPPWPFRVVNQELTLEIKIRIGSDGRVKDVQFITPSVSQEWNALAISKIREWQFSPAMVDGHPIPIWVKQSVHVRFEDASYIRLAEIVCDDQATADSVHALLSAGASFDSLAAHVSVAPSKSQGGYLGTIDLRTLPEHVKRKLRTTRTDSFTSPIMLGRQYVIYRVLPSGPNPLS